MKVSARSAGGQVCILHLARFNDFPGTKIVAIEPVQKTKPREKMVYFSLTAKLEWLTLVRVRPAATARAHSRSRNAFGEKTLTSCLTRVGGPEISQELLTPNQALLLQLRQNEIDRVDDGSVRMAESCRSQHKRDTPLRTFLLQTVSSRSPGSDFHYDLFLLK